MSMAHTLILKVRTQNFHSKIEKQLSKEETQTSSQISNKANDDPFLNYKTFKNPKRLMTQIKLYHMMKLYKKIMLIVFQ